MNSEKINSMQMLFCKEYMIDFNATQSAIRAGYSPKTAHVQASRLFSYPKIREHINLLIEKELGMKKGELKYRVLKKLSSIAFSESDEKIRTSDKIKALELLGKYGSLWTDKIDLSGKVEAENIKKFQVVDKNGNPIVTEKIDYNSLSEEEAKRLYFETINEITSQ